MDPDRWLHPVAEGVAARRGADLVVLPELWGPGYAYPERYSAWAERYEEALRLLGEAARAAGAWVVPGSLVAPGEDGWYNEVPVLSPAGQVVGQYRKIHVFGYQSREPEWLRPGRVPLVWDGPDATLGVSVCYDLRFPELQRVQVGAGAEVLVVVAAWPGARRVAWDILTRARAVENLAAVVACNGVGGALSCHGRSRAVGPDGELLAEAGEEETWLEVQVDLTHVRRMREEFPALRDRRPLVWPAESAGR